MQQEAKKKFDVALWLHNKKPENEEKNGSTLKVHGAVYFVSFILCCRIFIIVASKNELRHSTSFALSMSYFFILLLGLKLFTAFELRPRYFFVYFSKVAKIAHLCVRFYLKLYSLFIHFIITMIVCWLTGWLVGRFACHRSIKMMKTKREK